MSHSKTRFQNEDRKHYARCKCGFVTPKYDHEWQVDDDLRVHDEKIERIKAHLGPSAPSLKSQRDYYRKMATDPGTDPKDRPLWQHLADELSARLNDDVPVVQEELEIPWG